MEELSDIIYNSLGPGEVRLVSIFPGSDSDDLLLSLSITKLEELITSYEALSYVWGDVDPSERVKCNYAYTEITQVSQGMTCRRDIYSQVATCCVKVTSNLQKALLQLRTVDDCRTLWVDSICINQKETQEKSEQVSLMAKIYNRAERVLIWLGDEHKSTANAIQCLESLAQLRNVSPHEIAFGGLDADIGLRPWLLNCGDRKYIPHEYWRALKQLLLERPWFRRAWVHQEVAMSHRATIICGAHTFEWDLLFTACNTIDTLMIHTGERGSGKDVSHIVGRVLSMEHTRTAVLKPSGRQESKIQKARSRYLSLEDLLCDFRSTEATDPRDKVYGLLAMASALFDEPLPKPDYSLTIRQLYTSIAWNLLELSGRHNLRCLSYVQEMVESHNLPSWVPDWSKPFVTIPIFDSNDKFQAIDKTQVPIISYSPIYKAYCPIDLKIRGIRILTIKATDLSSGLLTPGGGRKHADMINAFPEPYPTTDQTYLEAYPGSINPMDPSEFGPASERRFGTFWEHVRAHEGQANYETTSGLSQRYTQQQLDKKLNFLFVEGRKSDGIAFGRAFFISRTGFMGLAPKAALPDDEIVLFLGARIPFVIRRSGNRNWNLIGECYVYGLMFGEAMEGLDVERMEDLVII